MFMILQSNENGKWQAYSSVIWYDAEEAWKRVAALQLLNTDPRMGYRVGQVQILTRT